MSVVQAKPTDVVPLPILRDDLARPGLARRAGQPLPPCPWTVASMLPSHQLPQLPPPLSTVLQVRRRNCIFGSQQRCARPHRGNQGRPNLGFFGPYESESNVGDQTVKTRVTISSACPALAVPGAPVALARQPRKALQALQALSAGRLG